MSNLDPTQQRIDQIVKSADVVLFMKGMAQSRSAAFQAGRFRCSRPAA